MAPEVDQTAPVWERKGDFEQDSPLSGVNPAGFSRTPPTVMTAVVVEGHAGRTHIMANIQSCLGRKRAVKRLEHKTDLGLQFRWIVSSLFPPPALHTLSLSHTQTQPRVLGVTSFKPHSVWAHQLSGAGPLEGIMFIWPICLAQGLGHKGHREGTCVLLVPGFSPLPQADGLASTSQ